MKREVLVLNIVCLVAAFAFVGFAVWNALSAESPSSFFTVDNLFITVFCLLMAFVFISVPGTWAMTQGGVKAIFGQGVPEPAASANRARVPAKAGATPVQGGTAGALPPAAEVQRDAKGRPLPPDVTRMTALMNKSQQKTP